MAAKDGTKGGYNTPEPTPLAPPEPLGRRAHDAYAGERIARMEEKLDNVEASVDRLDTALVKVHERIDELSSKFTDFAHNVHSRVSDVVQDVERTLDSHVQEEEKLFLARFASLADKMDANAKLSDERGKSLARTVKGIRNINVGVLTFVTVVLVPSVGYIAAKIIDHLPRLILLMDKLEHLR